MSRIKQYLMIALVAGTLLISQVACDEEVREPIRKLGCSNYACLEECGNNESCKIKCCQK